MYGRLSPPSPPPGHMLTTQGNWITVSYSYFHDHCKASLVGHADTNGAEDKGHLTVTFVGNHFKNIKWRTPSLRFGHGLPPLDSPGRRDGAEADGGECSTHLQQYV